MDLLADFLIWGAIFIIVVRFTLPRILEFFGIEVTKVDKKRPPNNDE